jgi:hypothetical protein
MYVVFNKGEKAVIYTFPNASEAALAVALHAAYVTDRNSPACQYELRATFDGERGLTGYQARVMNLDGFGIGYVGKGGEIGS